MMEGHLSVLSESLDEKLQILRMIQKYCEQQEAAFRDGKADLEEFDNAVEEKDKLVDRLTRLDDGFESLYEKLSEQLQGNRERYAPQIRELQEKIRQVTELSVAIQAQESRNKKAVEAYLSKVRQELSQNRRGSKAAYDYYKSMSGGVLSSPQFLDSKK